MSDTAYETLLTESAEGVRTITLNRPDRLNAFTPTLADELISALGKLDRAVARIPMEDATPATAHMFILNPFKNGGFARLFSTHPSTEERIARLQAMRGDAFRNLPLR